MLKLYSCVSAVAVFDSFEQLAVPRWNVVAGVKDLGVLGERVSRSSPETQLALIVLLMVSACALAILISRDLMH